MATNKKKLLITQSMAKVGWDLLRERGDIEPVQFPGTIGTPDFRALLAQHAPVGGVALGVTPFGEAEIAAAREMLVVARIGVGYDAVDVPALTKRKIPLMVAGSANSPSVAEQAMFMMMTLAKRGAELNAMVQANQWNKRMTAIPVDLYGKTVLIVGFGRIGTRSAKRCQAMEMTVLVYDPYVPAAAIIDEPALHRALVEKKLAGAGLDVYEQEPTPADNPLTKLPNVISAPHMA